MTQIDHFEESLITGKIFVGNRETCFGEKITKSDIVNKDSSNTNDATTNITKSMRDNVQQRNTFDEEDQVFDSAINNLEKSEVFCNGGLNGNRITFNGKQNVIENINDFDQNLPEPTPIRESFFSNEPLMVNSNNTVIQTNKKDVITKEMLISYAQDKMMKMG